jgi:hypothetical protein
VPTLTAPTETTWRWPPDSLRSDALRSDALHSDALAEARSREAEAIRSFRLALVRADETFDLAEQLLADLDRQVEAARGRLRQAGYLRG